jgi:hypothetical protein
MSYEISFEQKSDYLHAIVSGENSKENVTAYLADLRTECEARDCFRVLIEECLEGPRLDVMEVFTIASEGSMNALGKFEAIAYVDVNKSELMGFAETVAVNRGMPVAVFLSVEDAKQWLRHQKHADEQDTFLRDDNR